MRQMFGFGENKVLVEAGSLGGLTRSQRCRSIYQMSAEIEKKRRPAGPGYALIDRTSFRACIYSRPPSPLPVEDEYPPASPALRLRLDMRRESTITERSTRATSPIRLTISHHQQTHRLRSPPWVLLRLLSLVRIHLKSDMGHDIIDALPGRLLRQGRVDQELTKAVPGLVEGLLGIRGDLAWLEKEVVDIV